MKNGYGLGEIIKNAVSLAYTKTFYKDARFVRMPIYVRGKRFLKYGEGFSTGYSCRLEMFDMGSSEDKKLILGDNCKLGDYVHIAAGERITIGDNCLIASKVYISDISHGNYSGDLEHSSPESAPDSRKLYTNPVSIGKNVWIGENVCILPGISIGNGCIIGANAVVNKDVSDNCIVAGVPAKVLKKYNAASLKWE